MERWQGRVAVVTGASAGIGSAIVYQLLDAGVDVVALARRSENIKESVEKARKGAQSRGKHNIKDQKAGKLHCVKCDVCKDDDIINAFKWIKENTKGVDILVNNAGVVKNSGLTGAKTEDWSAVLNTNVLGLSICTREAIQQMKTRGVDDGHIIHIGSIVGHRYPKFGALSMYYASKHAVRVLTEGLRKELVAAKSKIRVTEVSPGLVKTDMTSGMTNIDESTFWVNNPYLQPDDISDAVIYALGVPQHVQIHEIIVKPVGEET